MEGRGERGREGAQENDREESTDERERKSRAMRDAGDLAGEGEKEVKEERRGGCLCL